MERFCAAGDGTEFADFQPVVITTRIVIQHIVLLKIARVMHKVVVHCVFAHFDGGISDSAFQIHRLTVARAGIEFLFRDRHGILLIS